jgi:excinuclease ABC subunit B
VEQLVRPTGLVDPAVEVRSTRNQILDLISEIRKRSSKDQRVLVTTLTKRMAEDLAEYLAKKDVKVRYMHSEIEGLERTELIHQLRRGDFDVLVGINLLREGLDIPEVSLVAILDADKEGFLRNNTSLIQTFGRAARHIDGAVIMACGHLHKIYEEAIAETEEGSRNRWITINSMGLLKKYHKTHCCQRGKSRYPFGDKINAKRRSCQTAVDIEMKMKLFAEDLNFQAIELETGFRRLRQLTMIMIASRSYPDRKTG